MQSSETLTEEPLINNYRVDEEYIEGLYLHKLADVVRFLYFFQGPLRALYWLNTGFIDFRVYTFLKKATFLFVRNKGLIVLLTN